MLQGAAVRKNERAARAATDARLVADGALATAEAAFAAAEAFLNEARIRAGGSAQGGLWWIDRELTEAKKYLPARAGGIATTRGARA